nr:hypothetical protein [Mesostigma viride]
MILIKNFIVAIEFFIWNRNNCRYILLCANNKLQNIQTRLSIFILFSIEIIYYALISKNTTNFFFDFLL